MTVQSVGDWLRHVCKLMCPVNLAEWTAMIVTNPEGGNVDLRVPYIGYGAESETLHGRGNLGLQRFAGACREAAEPRASSWRFLHVLALAR